MNEPLSPERADELLRSLRQKQGNWIDWGHACEQLQKGGYTNQGIFEETGIEAVYQNLVIVGARVYETLVEANVAEEIKTYYTGPRSDVLYEFRVLDRDRRVAAAQLAKEKNLTADEAKELAKAMKTFSRLSRVPEGFSTQPGDAIAYQCWKLARSKRDLQDRSRLIAKGLKFAQSQTARERVEKLLSDFTVVPSKTAPLLPVYRLELEEELPRIVAIAGTLPLSIERLIAIPKLEVKEPFAIVEMPANVSFMPFPGWQAVLKAEDPVALFSRSDRLPEFPSDTVEEVAILVDRATTQWDANSYFIAEREGNIELFWFEEEPEFPLLGRAILVLRPKRILDENVILEPWQMDD